MKAVRTRYRNTLDKELHAATALLKSDTTGTDSVSMLNKRIDILRKYIDKLEIQSVKLSDAVSESDTTFFEEVVNEDCALIEEAECCIICIKQHCGNAKARVKQENVTSNTSSSDVFDLQHQMQGLSAAQLKHQQEMFERQERRKREHQQEHSVKLPKLELVSLDIVLGCI